MVAASTSCALVPSQSLYACTSAFGASPTRLPFEHVENTRLSDAQTLRFGCRQRAQTAMVSISSCMRPSIHCDEGYGHQVRPSPVSFLETALGSPTTSKFLRRESLQRCGMSQSAGQQLRSKSCAAPPQQPSWPGRHCLR